MCRVGHGKCHRCFLVVPPAWTVDMDYYIRCLILTILIIGGAYRTVFVRIISAAFFLTGTFRLRHFISRNGSVLRFSLCAAFCLLLRISLRAALCFLLCYFLICCFLFRKVFPCGVFCFFLRTILQAVLCPRINGIIPVHGKRRRRHTE